MNSPGKIILISIATLVVCVCFLSFCGKRQPVPVDKSDIFRWGGPGPRTQPVEAHVDLSDDTIDRFDTTSNYVLLRYLQSSGGWEVRDDDGVLCAIRLQKFGDDGPRTSSGEYSAGGGDEVQVRRVRLAFGRMRWCGNGDEGGVTHAKAGGADVPLTIEGPHAGSPTNSSQLVVEGKGGLFLEISEESPLMTRPFTQQTFTEVSAELSAVLANLGTIRDTGLLPNASPYATTRPTAPSFQVNDGFPPGEYLLEAAVAPTTPGYVYAKVFDARSGEELSAREVRRDSIRYVGWSTDGQTFFPYGAVIMIFDGSDHFQAKFELWHHGRTGQETKLITVTRIVTAFEP